MLSGMAAEGLSQPYIDRLDKLFAIHIPRRLKLSRLDKVSPKALAGSLTSVATQGGNLRILKSFLAQVYRRAREFDACAPGFSDEFSSQFWKKWQSANKLPFPELSRLMRADYEKIFARLEAEDDRWQQALCIRLFFMLGAPMSRLMQAQWWQIVDDRWFPYLPEEKVYWFESSEHLKEDAKRVLEKASARVTRGLARSGYWFPSPVCSRAPISSVQGLWQDVLEGVGSRYFPVCEFAQSFRRPNNPSYAMTVVRQYGRFFREMHNAAEVSKVLYRQRQIQAQSIR